MAAETWTFDGLIQHLTEIYNDNGGDATCAGIYLDYEGEREYEKVGLSFGIDMNFDLDLPHKDKSKKEYKPVVHAHWKEIGHVSDYDCICSNCNGSGIPSDKFCSHCGAEMDEIIERVD